MGVQQAKRDLVSENCLGIKTWRDDLAMFLSRLLIHN